MITVHFGGNTAIDTTCVNRTCISLFLIEVVMLDELLENNDTNKHDKEKKKCRHIIHQNDQSTLFFFFGSRIFHLACSVTS